MHRLVFRFHHTGVRQFFTTKNTTGLTSQKFVKKEHKGHSFVFFDIVFCLDMEVYDTSTDSVCFFIKRRLTEPVWTMYPPKMMVSKFGSSPFPRGLFSAPKCQICVG